MFWSQENKEKKAAQKAAKKSQKLRAQALANAKAARENIGEETLDRIVAAMTAKQKSNTEQAKAAIQGADKDRVAEELRYMFKEE